MLQWLLVILILILSVMLVTNTYRKMPEQQRQELKQPHVFISMSLLIGGQITVLLGIAIAYTFVLHIGASLVLLGFLMTCFISWRKGKMASNVFALCMLLAVAGVGAYVVIMS